MRQGGEKPAYLIRRVTGLGGSVGLVKERVRKKTVFGIALTFVFNFPLVQNAIQLLREGESRERDTLHENCSIPKIKNSQLPFNTVGPNSSSSCNLVRWLHRHPKLTNEELTLESSLFKGGQFHATRVSDYNWIYRLFIVNVLGNGAEKEAPGETNSKRQTAQGEKC